MPVTVNFSPCNRQTRRAADRCPVYRFHVGQPSPATLPRGHPYRRRMPRVPVPLPDRDFDVTEVADEVAAALWTRPED